MPWVLFQVVPACSCSIILEQLGYAIWKSVHWPL